MFSELLAETQVRLIDKHIKNLAITFDSYNHVNVTCGDFSISQITVF